MTLMAASWSESSMHANDYGREALTDYTDADVPPYKYLDPLSLEAEGLSQLPIMVVRLTNIANP